jgi:response regulator RpfG family c-di-GMP phosphodiesterase
MIVITTGSDRDSGPDALASGADEYLDKSEISPGMLERCIRHTIERRRAKDSLRCSREQLEVAHRRYEALVRGVPQGLCTISHDWLIEFANPALSTMLAGQEHGPDTLAGTSFESLFASPQGFEDFARSVPAVVAMPDNNLLELELRRFDGTRFPCEISIVRHDPLETEGGYLAVLNDVSDRRQTKLELESQLQRLSALRTIDVAISGSTDLRVTLMVLLEQVTIQLGVDAADILLDNRQTGMLDFAAGRGFRTSALQNTHLRPGEGFAGRAAIERRTVSVPDLRKSGEAFADSPLLAGEGFVTYFAVPLVAKGRVCGVLEIFHRATLTPDQQWSDFMNTLAGQAAIAIDNIGLFEELQRSHQNMSIACDTTLEGWSRALELRDIETHGHSQRVTSTTLRLARAMGMSDDDLIHVRRGALLHDVGKMGIPDSILHKPGPLTEDEWEIMRLHPVHAFKALMPIGFLRPAIDIPYCHHEKWDGSGYPRGLKGEQIPLAARVFAIVDVWDALQSDRPYRKAWPKEQALNHICSEAGSHFDPAVVETFMRISA